MKKLFILFIACLPLGGFASEGVFTSEPLLLINPSRETFLNFPSAILPNKTVTVFLPESAVPLHQSYPVVYILGSIPKDAPAAQEVLNRAKQKAILIGINTTEEDLADTSKLVSFFTQELIPYVSTNYSTIDDPSFRAIAVQGKRGLQMAAALLATKQLFGRAIFYHTSEESAIFPEIDANLRVWVEGTRTEIWGVQQTLIDMGRQYGPDFVTRLSNESTGGIWAAIQLDYLFAPSEDLQVDKIKGYFVSTPLSIEKKEQLPITWKVRLTNKMLLDLIPFSLRITPPYLNWNAQGGYVSILSGAVPGKVKIGISVDKVGWTGKIRLKK